MADEGGDPNRPSFAGFWKRSKDAWGGKRIRFVDGTPAQAQAQAQAQGEGSSGESLCFIASVYLSVWLAAGASPRWNSKSDSDWVAWRRPVGVTKICHGCPGLQRHPMARRLWLGRWLGFGTGPARTWAAGTLASPEAVDMLVHLGT